MTTHNRAVAYAFLSGVETFHAFIHAYFYLSKTNVRNHPVELLGGDDTPKLHAIGALVNGAIAIFAGLKVVKLVERQNS